MTIHSTKYGQHVLYGTERGGDLMLRAVICVFTPGEAENEKAYLLAHRGFAKVEIRVFAPGEHWPDAIEASA
jgi:hypothetical protein